MKSNMIILLDLLLASVKGDITWWVTWKVLEDT